MTQAPSPAAPAVATERLRDALQAMLTPRQILALSRRPATYYSSFRMEELGVRLDDGTNFELVFKDLSPGALLHDARRCKPPFLLDPRREIAVYRHLVRPHRLGPQFLGAVEDTAAGLYWLFVEKVDGAPLWQVGDLSLWRAAAAWAARTHTRVSGHGPARAAQTNLIRYDETYYRRWARWAAERTAGREGDAELRTLWERYDHVVRRLTRLPVTFIHGEYHASNIVIRTTPREGERVCPVDWEMAALGPGVMDLADLTAGNWTDAERADMTAAYRDVTPRGWTEEDLDYCRLHRGVQWLGWSDDWTPPREHAQDWRAEVVRLARKLGI